MRRAGLMAIVASVLAVAACSGSGGDGASGAGDTGGADLVVAVVSTRPDMVTGGNALLEIGGTGTPEVTVGGRALRVEPLGERWLVDGIPDGPATLEVRRGSERGSVAVTVHPITGPVFSGPHLPLLVCTTEDHGLGAATDDDCSAPAKVDYLYRGAGGLKPLPERDAVPDDVQQVTVDGKQVPFVVRRERGVINRSVYWITKLDTAWNGRLVYRFGGGCGFSYGQGGTLGTTAEAEAFLRAGYAVATATFNTFQTQCNDVLSAETALMVKEHFIEEFGVPVHTIGEGASGGAIQVHLILQNYPGILDGAVAVLPFPDAFSIAPGVSDCGLLHNYYRTPAGAALTADQRAAINGHAVEGTCTFWVNSFLEGVRPQDGCARGIPASRIYDAATNRDGLRCDLVDANVNQVGRDAATGFAQRALDNVGVQYGFEALRDGKIGVDQFLDLNERIGGYDVDGNVVAEREEATEESMKAVYAKGRIAMGGGDLGRVPLIDLNIYQDAAGDIHDRFRAFTLRDRLASPNHVIWTRPGTGDVIGNIVSGGGGAGDDAIGVIDRWLTTGTMPPEAVDNCVTRDGRRLRGTDIYETPGPCRDEYPLHDDPRTAAGAPRRNDIGKCALKPVDAGEYGVPFSAAQEERLRRIFPRGVCDWTKPGVGQVPLEGTWLRY
jgi:hypothetical protein